MSGPADSAAPGGELQSEIRWGVQVSDDLHVRLIAVGGLCRAAWSPEPGVDPRAEVEREIARLRRRLDDLLAWLIQYRRDHGEVMERVMERPDASPS
jgi:hypothetical protein